MFVCVRVCICQMARKPGLNPKSSHTKESKNST